MKKYGDDGENQPAKKGHRAESVASRLPFGK